MTSDANDAGMLAGMLSGHSLFSNLTSGEIGQLLQCFSFRRKQYSRMEYMILEGDYVHEIGIILSGTVLMEKNDLYGNNYFYRELREREIFAEPFIGKAPVKCSVNYRAITDCDILYFSFADVWSPCEKKCRCHAVFAENLSYLLALKTRSLLSKIEIISKNSMRDRIMTFFSLMRGRFPIMGIEIDPSGSKGLSENQIFIPLNRTEMAEYLCVNRSALSRELGRMEKEGLILCSGNIITICDLKAGNS